MINYSKLKKLESQNKNTVNNKEMIDTKVAIIYFALSE